MFIVFGSVNDADSGVVFMLFIARIAVAVHIALTRAYCVTVLIFNVLIV